MNTILPKEQGLKLLSVESNKVNLEAFKKILPHFFYNDETNKRIISNFKKSGRNDDEQYIDDLFKMDDYRRTFIQVPQNPDTDEGYKKYYSLITIACDSTSTIRRLINDYDLRSYNVYSSGKLTVNKQQCKLFKFILQKKILSKEKIEEITTIRQSSGKLYIVVSRNPIDYIMCSTNQSFTSCLGLESKHYEAFYMGLGSLTLDPNRILIYLTNGKHKRYTVKDNEFKHFKVLSRSWGVIGRSPDCDTDVLNIAGYYPGRIVKFGHPICKNFPLRINNRDDPYRTLKQKFLFKMPEFIDGMGPSFIYLDNFGLSKQDNGIYGYSRGDGQTGCIMEPWKWERGFENLNDFDELTGAMRCEKCNCRVSENNAHWDRNDHVFCKTCFEIENFRCQHCGITDKKEKGHEHDGVSYCERCFDNNFKTCAKCDSVTKNNDVIHCTKGDFCKTCYDTMFKECLWCGDVLEVGLDTIKINNVETYCQNCHGKVFGGESGNVFETFDILAEAC